MKYISIIIVLILNIISFSTLAAVHGIFIRNHLKGCELNVINFETTKERIIKKFTICPNITSNIEQMSWSIADGRFFYVLNNEIYSEDNNGKEIYRIKIPKEQFGKTNDGLKIFWDEEKKTLLVAMQEKIPKNLLDKAQVKKDDPSTRILNYLGRDIEVSSSEDQTFIFIYKIIAEKKASSGNNLKYNYELVNIKLSSLDADLYVVGLDAISVQKNDDWFPNNKHDPYEGFSTYREKKNKWPKLYLKNAAKMEKLILEGETDGYDHSVYLKELAPGTSILLEECGAESYAAMCGPIYICKNYCEHTVILNENEKNHEKAIDVFGSINKYFVWSSLTERKIKYISADMKIPSEIKDGILLGIYENKKEK